MKQFSNLAIKARSLLDKTTVQVLIITIFTVGVYLNTLGSQFVWDDRTFANWELTRSFKYLPQLLRGALPSVHEGDYRPIKGVILLLDYQLWGSNVLFYHIQAISIHLFATLMFYLLGRKILESTLGEGKAGLVSFLAALIFGVHPVHTEAVTFITSSTDIIGIGFFAAAFYFYIKATDQYKIKTKYFWISLAFALLAFISYEVTLVLPILLLVYELCFKLGKIDYFRKKVINLWPYFVSIGAYIVVRFFILKVIETNLRIGGSFYLTMLAMTKVMVKYVWLMIFPLNLSLSQKVSEGLLALTYIDYNPAAFVAQKITDTEIVLSIAVIISILITAIFCYKKLPIVTFCILWFFIALAPFSNVIPLNNLMTERYLYLASFSWCLLFAYVVISLLAFGDRSFSGKFLKFSLIALFIFIIAFYSFQTITRNHDWKDSMTLWTSTQKAAADSVIANFNLANAYFDKEDYVKAIEFYKNAKKYNNLNYPDVNIHLANAYSKVGEEGLAIAELQEASSANPYNYEIWYGLGKRYFKLDQRDLAMEAYYKSLSIEPNFYDALLDLGTVFARDNQFNLAIGFFKKAIGVNANLLVAHQNLAGVYAKLGQYDLAMKEYEKSVEIDPDNDALKKKLQEMRIIKNARESVEKQEL